MATDPYLSVAAVTKYIKKKFDADPHLRDVYIKGELSNVKIHTSGHIYFTLKDQKARLPGVMFSARAKSVKFRPESGMTVLIRGDISVYEASGQYQLYAQSMQPDGIGDYFLAFEQLKEKLGKQGLFDAVHKKPLPQYPEKVGVITAQTGAAVRDILTTLKRRYPLADIVLFPTLVQGQGAVQSIVQSIQQANRTDSDVLIVGRGGGSIEDLWAFNEEAVARAIFDSQVPVISAVGHETDTTIADFVADLRAATPTAAAELAVPSRTELFERVMAQRQVMFRHMTNDLEQRRIRLKQLQNSYPMAYPDRLYRPFIERVERAADALQRETQLAIRRSDDRLAMLSRQLDNRKPIDRIRQAERELTVLRERLDQRVGNVFKERDQQLKSALRTLDALSPLKIMDRGYAIPFRDGEVVKSVHQLAMGDRLSLSLQDGDVQTVVEAINSNDKERE